MQQQVGAPPKHGWARLVPELHVTNLKASLSFWESQLGFAIAYQRPEERFAYLERAEGAQLMLCELHERFVTSAIERPFGRGIMLQVYVDDVEPVLANLLSAHWPIYMEPREIWRRVGDIETGQREFFVQDPDGYLVMIWHPLGDRLARQPCSA